MWPMRIMWSVLFRRIRRSTFWMQVIDKASAVQFVRGMAPDWAWLLQHIESQDGYVRFPPLFSQIITNLKIENYPELYENEAFIGAMMLRAFMGPEEIKNLNAELEALSPEDRAKYLVEASNDLKTAGDAIQIAKTPVVSAPIEY